MADLTVVVNIGDDEEIYGLYVSPDVDTVLYTLAECEGPDGWGVADDTFSALERLASFGVDTTFRIGDRDLAVHLFRTSHLGLGWSLSKVTDRLATRLGVTDKVLPASDDPVRTWIRTSDGTWRSFQDYFVLRGHQDPVHDVRFEGAAVASAAPGVIEAIEDADVVVIGPSNPPLSIWPVLAIPGIASAVEAAKRVMAVSPFFGGKALKGPADRVLASLGFPAGNEGVVRSYEGLLTDLVVDGVDAADRRKLADEELVVHVADTRIAEPEAAAAFASWLVDLL